MRTEDQILADYKQYRGKCKEYCEAEIAKDQTLKLVRGHYICPHWGEQAHWWCEREDGTVVDPTKAQFPSNGVGFYVPFSGTVECSNCGIEKPEEEMTFESKYAFCSMHCHMRFVGL